MKFVKRTAQAFASIVVLSLLLSGSVFAYSTRLSHISSLASPSPLDDDKSSSTTTEHEDKSSTTTSSTTTEHEDKSSTTTTEHDKNEVNQVNAKEEGKTDEEDINKAKDSKQIPAVVEVSGSGSTITQIDSKFSVSVSRPSDNSLSVSIAGANG